MKRWLRVRISYFRSFLEEQTFEFPVGPGLFFMTGRNEVQPRMGANGVGKTTMFEAIYWLFTGKTVAGLTAGQIAPWDGSKGTKVELDYEGDDDRLYTLGRTWSPNRWYLVHENGSDELLIAQDSGNLALHHLGMSPALFLNCILMAQGSTMFLDLTAEAATNLFSDILGLDKWLDLSTKASKKASDVDRELRSLESSIARVKGNLDGLRESVFDFTAEEWEARREHDLRALEEDHKKKLALRAEIKKDLTKSHDYANFLAKSIREIEGNRGRSDDRGSPDIQTRVSELSASEAVLADRLKKAEKATDEQSKITACDKCGHVLTKEEHDKILMGLLDAEDSLKDELAEVRDQLAKAKQELNAKSACDAISHGTLRDHERNLGFTKLDIQKYESDLNQVDKDLDRLEDEVERRLAEKNPVTEAEVKLKTKKDRLLKDLRSLEDEQAELERRYRLFSFWVRGFKDIRLSQVSEALTQLELEVNSCMTKLGLVGWKIFFRPDSETKSGSIKRGFAVEVLSPNNDKPVPWKAWSGGEAQRLRLAGNMGLANLIRDRLGITLPIEVWDEPTQFLSPRGVTDLLDCLSERATEENRQIWIVDHRSLGYAFGSVHTVVKDAKGSRFEIATV